VPFDSPSARSARAPLRAKALSRLRRGASGGRRLGARDMSRVPFDSGFALAQGPGVPAGRV